MQLKELVLHIKKAVYENNAVNSFYYGGINTLLNDRNVKYPGIILTIQSGNVQESNQNGVNRIDRFTFQITYIDRMTESMKHLDIHNTAYYTLKDIINRFKAKYYEYEEWHTELVSQSSISFYNDNSIGADICTGASITFSVDIDNNIGDCYFEDIDIC